MSRPNKLINLQTFADYFACGKATISEDIDLIRASLLAEGLGNIETIAGKAGGIIYRTELSPERIRSIQERVGDKMSEGKRVLPGNYIYVNDLLQDPLLLDEIAQLIASYYCHLSVDQVLTIETKGIGLAVAVAHYLSVPYTVVRRESSHAEGSTISINYLSGYNQAVQKMELSKNSLAPDSRVLFVDDFLRNGGTVNGVLSLLDEFDCQAVGICVFAENKAKERMNIPNYQALFETKLIFNKTTGHYQMKTSPGNFFKNNYRP